MVATRVTIPLTWGDDFSMGVLELITGFLYLSAGFSFKFLRFAACLVVDSYVILKIEVFKY
jgi:hypothetical protein